MRFALFFLILLVASGPLRAAAPEFMLSIGVPGAAPAGAPKLSAGIAMTGHIDPERVRAGLKLPFDPSNGETDNARSKPESALETFAMLTVALAGGESRDTVLKRFGLTEESRQALAEHWGDRIAKDSGLRDVYSELVRKHRGR